MAHFTIDRTWQKGDRNQKLVAQFISLAIYGKEALERAPTKRDDGGWHILEHANDWWLFPPGTSKNTEKSWKLEARYNSELCRKICSKMPGIFG